MPARDNNSRIALITGVSGPVVYARSNSPMRLNEAVYVGPMNLLAEIVRLDGTELVAQVYEETSGLRPGDWLTGSGRPLSVMLGPGILGGIYDGLLRPLWNKGNYISRGKSAEPPRHYRFDPLVSQGEKITGGERIGIVYSEGGIKQFTLAPPFFGGTVTAIVSGGEYHEDECLCQLADSTGRIAEINLVQPWPVRSPRPFAL
ncbi:MAG: hypothetical protein OEZ23_04790, partial [Gammaproteobacteria bacterium]|nr:hypothetical protein [Gammaproteobacteria bacterium]